MAMAMSIHRTLCVLVSPENFTPRDVPSQQIRKPLLRADFNFLSPPLFFLKISLLEMLIAFGNEHLKTHYTMIIETFMDRRETSCRPGLRRRANVHWSALF